MNNRHETRPKIAPSSLPHTTTPQKQCPTTPQQKQVAITMNRQRRWSTTCRFLVAIVWFVACTLLWTTWKVQRMVVPISPSASTTTVLHHLSMAQRHRYAWLQDAANTTRALQQPQHRVVANTRKKSSSSSSSSSYFVVHVGPPKTATTTIQVGLQQLNDTLLQEDHVYYGYNMETDVFLKLKDFKCHRILRQVRYGYYANVTNTTTGTRRRHEDQDKALVRKLLRVPCWRSAVESLQDHRHIYGRQNNNSDSSMSWLYSCESFATFNTVAFKYFDWESLRLTLKYYLRAQLVVVLTYRRYADWLHSMYRHAMKYTGRKPAWEFWPTDPQETRGIVEPFFPQVLDYLDAGRPKDVNFPFLYIDEMWKLLSESFLNAVDMRILNLHHPNYYSPISNMLCAILPDVTPHACQASLAEDAKHLALAQQQLQTNYKNSSTTRLILNDAASEESLERRPTILNYDRLVVAAYFANKFVDHTNMYRRQAGLKARKFHQQTLGGNEEDLPMICPDPTHMERFWQHVLRTEEELHTLFVGDNTPATSTKEQLRQAFDTLVAYPRVCLVDTLEVLKNSTWEPLWGKLNRLFQQQQQSPPIRQRRPDGEKFNLPSQQQSPPLRRRRPDGRFRRPRQMMMMKMMV
eukprot:scaffold10660_cov176-Amphora_coffeaeformis.AAC.2